MPASDPGPARPDPSDWTWVLQHPCPQCGFVAADVTGDDIPGLIRSAGGRFAAALERDDASERPEPDVWSALEYGCHARDVCDLMRSRLELILSGGGAAAPVRFADWDQDAAAAEQEYWRSDPELLREQLLTATDTAAAAFARPTGDQWSWPGLRSNGSTFTALTLGQYLCHELQHHLWDIAA